MTIENDMGAHPAGEDAHRERGNTYRNRDNIGRSSPDVQESTIPILDGWAILPCHSMIGGCCTCGSMDCTAKGKHPKTSHGVKDASTDPARWDTWSKWGEVNWALACGRVSNVFVIDIDKSKGGFESWEEFEMSRRGEAFRDTLKVRTGGGGLHIYLRYPAVGAIRNRVGWLPGVDVRSDGGYVILPPASHASGRRYEWLNWGIPIAEPPSDLVEALGLSVRKFGLGGGHSTSGELPSTQEAIDDGLTAGDRNNTMHALACRWWREFGTAGRIEVYEIARKVWDATPDHDSFPWAEVERAVESARSHIEDSDERDLEFIKAYWGARRGH